MTSHWSLSLLVNNHFCHGPTSGYYCDRDGRSGDDERSLAARRPWSEEHKVLEMLH